MPRRVPPRIARIRGSSRFGAGASRSWRFLGSADGEFRAVASGFTRSATEAIADHRAYADAARQSALHALVDFVDLQPSFEGPDGVVPGLFRADRIHMSDAGNARIADALQDDVVAR